MSDQMSKDWRNELVTKGAAFDALTEIENQYEFEDGHDHLMGWAKTKIFALPPEQPEKRTEERTETHARDLIDRQAAIDALGEKPLVWDDLSDFDLGKAAQWADDVDAIKALPSAQPEIIRCKDCAKYDKHDHRCKHWNHGVVVMDWCSRKRGGKNETV